MLVVRADYKKYPIPVLEKMRIDEDEFYKKYDACVVVQTCNRIEAYFDTEVNSDLNCILNDFSGFDILKGKNATFHFLKVSCGMDSMILGENQILGQIKTSFQKARELKKTSRYLDSVFLKAIHVGQRARTETKINEGSVSIGSAAVELAEKNFGLANKNVLLIGAGEIGTLVAKALMEKHIKAVIVANRTYERAETLAKELKGMAVHFDKLKEAINFSDVIICATSSPHYILKKEDLIDVGNKIIIDIANPRDVDDAVRELENINLYTIDDLRNISDKNLQKRIEEVPAVEKIIDEEYDVLMKQIEKINVEEVLKDFNNYIEEIRTKELEKAIKLSKTKNPEEIMENFSKAFAKRITHDFVSYSINTSKEDLMNSAWWKHGK
ncbi:glutamyl-tRNA reductase [Methanococcus maripaludis]|uniref:Glutamyl-tRNA reductase n=1 Tax=Methanococcus maripaludis TaxID=39152 RepID=A0A7J9S3K1_METMI|nr:glutamyl-tRNA reductase [Methanococcus maripaludis]MBB6068300.1 glutamyl-tRNA reductase [Methanococcus maripaludis]